MADKSTDAPLGATHYNSDGAFYKFDGEKWQSWVAHRKMWVFCVGNKPAASPHNIERIQPLVWEAK